MNQTGKPLEKLTKIEAVVQRGDLSPFLGHLTRSGRITLPCDIYGLREDGSRMINARKNLRGIIEKSVIKAISLFGFFNDKVRFERFGQVLKNHDSKVQRHWLRSVCLTEPPVEHVHIQVREISSRNLHFEPYGLPFWESAIRKQGGNPLFYFESTNQAVISSLDAIALSEDCERFRNTLPFMKVFVHRFIHQSAKSIFAGSESGVLSVISHLLRQM
jgi:hypothetical protein